MTLHPLFALLYIMMGYLIGWAVYAHLTTFVVVYILLLAVLLCIHLAYVNDLKRSETNDND